MTRLTPLVDAVRAAQAGNPLGNPVTVLCMSGARDDVMAALAADGIALNVAVHSLNTFVGKQFPTLLDPAELAAMVIAELQALPADSQIRARGLAGEAATRAGVRKAVWELLHAPREKWAETGTRTLPTEVAAMAQRIAARVPEKVLPHQAWDGAVVPERTIVWDVVGTAPHEDRLLARLPEPLRPVAVAGEVRRRVVSDEHTQSLAVLSGVRGTLNEGALHKVGVALLNPDFAPVLADAAQGLPLHMPGSLNLLDDPVTATVVGLLEINPDTMPRADLAEVLLRGCIGWKDAEGKSPKIFGFDAFSRHKEGPRSWPNWKDYADKRVEAAWVVALRRDLLSVRAATTWTEWAARAQALVKAHVDGKVAKAFFERLAGFDALGIQYSLLSAQEALREAAEATPLRERDEWVAGLRVGTLDSFVGCDLDLLVVCNASTLFLPRGVAEPAGVAFAQVGTSVEAETRRQEELLAGALRAASAVEFIHPRQLTGGEFSGDASHWIPAGAVAVEGAEASDFPQANARIVDFGQALEGRLPLATLTAVDVLRSRSEGEATSEFNGFLDGFVEWLDGREFSASALNLFVESPYLFFVKYVANMQELEADPEEDLDPRDKGTIFHAIVEEWTRCVWLQASPRPLSGADIDWDAAEQTLWQVMNERLGQPLLQEITELSRLAFAEQLRFGLSRWFEKEKERADEGWVPVAVELDFGRKSKSGIVVPIATEFGEFSLAGKIDRVDFHPVRGELRVVDYKTNRSNKFHGKYTLNWEEPKSFTVQPDFYGLAMWVAASKGILGAALERAGFDVSGLDLLDSLVEEELTVKADFHFVFVEKPEEQHLKITIDAERRAEFTDFLRTLLDLVAVGDFAPRELDYGFSGYIPAQVMRLGANNYDRQAAAVSDWLRQRFAVLSPDTAEGKND